jgi:hypothetical protein
VLAVLAAAAGCRQTPPPEIGEALEPPPPAIVDPAARIRAEGGCVLPDPSQTGRVQSVSPRRDYVILSLGQAHLVEPGQIVDVTRDGSPIATLRVSSAGPDWSAADVEKVELWEEIRSGDQAVPRQAIASREEYAESWKKAFENLIRDTKGGCYLPWPDSARVARLDSSSVAILDGSLPANRRYAIEREDRLVASLRVFHDGGSWCAARIEWLAPGEAVRMGDLVGPHP